MKFDDANNSSLRSTMIRAAPTDNIVIQHGGRHYRCRAPSRSDLDSLLDTLWSHGGLGDFEERYHWALGPRTSPFAYGSPVVNGPPYLHPPFVNEEPSISNRVPRPSTNPRWHLIEKVMRAAVSGELRAEYFRWFPYNGGVGGEVALEVIFLLGTDAEHMRADLQSRDQDRHYAVVHIHFRSGGTDYFYRMIVSQINVRFAQTIQNMEEWGDPTQPGSYQIIQTEKTGFQCPEPEEEPLVLQLVWLIRGWGTRGDLFDLFNPDKSHAHRVRSGPGAGSPVLCPAGKPYSMFDPYEVWYRDDIDGQGLAFHPDGDLYTPPRDIRDTPGFYQAT